MIASHLVFSVFVVFVKAFVEADSQWTFNNKPGVMDGTTASIGNGAPHATENATGGPKKMEAGVTAPCGYVQKQNQHTLNK